MRHSKIKITLFALACALLLAAASLFAFNYAALAKGTLSVYGSGTNVFTPSGEANIVVDKQSGDDGDKYYTMFTFGYDEDNVSYRRNVAYNWYEGVEQEGVKKPVNGLFNLRIGFKDLSFKKFIVTFESQQYAKTEDAKTVNYVIFFPEGEGVKVLITDDREATPAADATVISPDRIDIRFTEKLDGAYALTVSNDGNPSVSGTFTNVGGNYAKYVQSSTTPVYPLIFNAEFNETAEGETKPVAKMVLYSFNNQSFEITGATQSGDEYTGGTVTDDTAAVLCLNKEISHLEIGGEVKFDYQLIDVLRTSPSSTLYYYALKYEDTLDSTINYNDFENERYTEVKTDLLLDPDKDMYLPETECAGFGEDFRADMAVKAYAKIKDTSSNGEESYVFLDWYLKDKHRVKVNGYDFIAVGDDKEGVTFNHGLNWTEICRQYQEKVDEAAKNLSAGSSSYFYLPSAEKLFADNSTAYENMKISIYYYHESQSSNTSLSANNLQINVTKPGSYYFTLYATDAESNQMYYMKDGKREEFSSGDIWDFYGDEEKHDILPWFSFNVDYKGVQIKEKTEKQSTAYVGTNYTSASFDINGIANSYETKYRLFLFDRARYYADTKVTFTYEEFIKAMDGLFDGKDTRKYFKEIKEVKETDENYEEFKDYAWSTSGTSFTPQDGNAFYYMRVEVTDTSYNTDPVTGSLAIVSSVESKALKGDSEWLKNNVASVILLAITGVLLIAIILLLVIKPKNKEDIDVQYEKELMKTSKSGKKKK